jgi:hypothetical protein
MVWVMSAKSVDMRLVKQQLLCCSSVTVMCLPKVISNKGTSTHNGGKA